ncbi:MAG TPA: DUF6152 family protein [Bryobacteraceae bacterium]
MRIRTKFLIAFMALAASAAAHHSFQAEFDDKKIETLQGVVTKFEWMNPHAYFYFDVTDESGKVTNWAMQSRNLSILARQGWTRRTLQAGDKITVTFWHHRDPAKNIGFAKLIVKADGTKYDVTPGQ